jgi:2-keto-4-pentenoate hydratase/2-oxohepta-3-ene-1,7-dioic acid hydratase in catechol pathway
MIVAPSVVGAANKLQLKTIINGEVRQDTNTGDLLFDVPTIVSF